MRDLIFYLSNLKKKVMCRISPIEFIGKDEYFYGKYGVDRLKVMSTKVTHMH